VALDRVGRLAAEVYRGAPLYTVSADMTPPGIPGIPSPDPGLVQDLTAAGQINMPLLTGACVGLLAMLS
jgi:hypothetical protein